MKGYSIGGYFNALLRRSEKTLLVEGITDQSLIKRLKLQRSAAMEKELPGNIDPVHMLDDESLSGMGNKARIVALLAAIPTNEKFNASINEKLGSLIDREWDGVDIDLQLQTAWSEPIQKESHFVTKGHSIENYFFSVEAAEAYLLFFFADHVSQDFIRDLRARYHQILALAVIYSLSIRRITGLGRSGGAITRELVRWDEERFLLTEGINEVLTNRGLIISVEFVQVVNENIDLYLARHADIEPGRWICHGHLGEQAIWACIAHIAGQHGINNEVQNEIERGARENKVRHSVDYLCRENLAHSVPLTATLDWLVS